jgi:hypothetical protein
MREGSDEDNPEEKAAEESAVRPGAVVVEPGGDPARDPEPDDEAERREHRPLPPRAEMVVQVEPFFQFLDNLVVYLAAFGHERDFHVSRRRAAVGGAGLEPATYGV